MCLTVRQPGAPRSAAQQLTSSQLVRSAVCQRIGHGGASALAPANTLRLVRRGLEVGVDMVEFDLRGWRGELLLAHTPLDARRPAT